MTTKSKKRFALVGLNLTLASLLIFTGLLVLSAREAMGQGAAGGILPAATEIADKLPTDLVRLALTGMIVMALVLVSVVTVFLRAMSAHVKEFTETVRRFGDKPCLLESEQGLAIMRDRFAQAARKARCLTEQSSL